MVIMWLVIALSLAISLMAAALCLPVALQSLADYREGWLTLGLFAFLFLVLGVGPIVSVFAVLAWAWLYRKSTLSDGYE